MKVGEVGAGSGYLARYIAERVGPEGHVYANELEPKMVAYMNDTGGQGRSQELDVVKGTATSTGFEPASLDAIAVVYALSFFDNREAMLKSIHESLKPGGLLLVVDSRASRSAHDAGDRCRGTDRARDRRRISSASVRTAGARALRADFP